MPIEGTREVVKRARAMPKTTAAAKRVERAVAITQGTATLVGRQGAEREDVPITSAGEVVGRVQNDYVLLNNTALSALRPRVQRMLREEVAAMLQRFCEETGVWPERIEA